MGKTFKVGAKVKVLRVDEDWDGYVSELDEYVGQEFEVLTHTMHGKEYLLSPCDWWFPSEWLELVQDEHVKSKAYTAPDFLQEAKDCIGNRASERDQEEERSMQRAVNIFNAFRSRTAPLSETDGWMFMVCLKMARSVQGNYKRDDFVDGAAYFGLAGESEERKLETEECTCGM